MSGAKRDDIAKVITVAGNLDHDFWTTYHHISPLTGSLNPVNYTKRLKKIPQYHLIGSDDKIMPKDVYNSYKRYFKNTKKIQSKRYKADHTKGWEKSYEAFLSTQIFP